MQEANLPYFVEFASTGRLFPDHAAILGEQESLEFRGGYAVGVDILHGALRVYHGGLRRFVELPLYAAHGLTVVSSYMVVPEGGVASE